MPLIGISVDIAEDFLRLRANYAACIRNFGGTPLLLPPCNEREAADYAEELDGLLLTGGGDLAPALYGEPNKGSEGIVPQRDETELALCRAFANRCKPVLGICRGIQLLCVAMGGTLVQDIPAAYGTQHSGGVRHEVLLTHGGLLHTLYQTDTLSVNSFHHQAVKRIPDGFTALAYSAEGFAEAIGRDNLLGVQWHPERLTPEENAPVFRWLLEQAARKSR